MKLLFGHDKKPRLDQLSYVFLCCTINRRPVLYTSYDGVKHTLSQVKNSSLDQLSYSFVNLRTQPEPVFLSVSINWCPALY